MRLMIRRIVADFDMRSMQDLRKLKRALHKGQVVVALNKRLNIAKVIDCEGGIYDAPRPSVGMEFDRGMINYLMYDGLGIETTQLRKVA